MNIIRKIFAKYYAYSDGTTALEYAIIIALMVVAIVGGITAFASSNEDTYNLVTEQIAVN